MNTKAKYVVVFSIAPDRRIELTTDSENDAFAAATFLSEKLGESVLEFHNTEEPPETQPYYAYWYKEGNRV